MYFQILQITSNCVIVSVPLTLEQREYIIKELHLQTLLVQNLEIHLMNLKFLFIF